jgi:hypothetical protein
VNNYSVKSVLKVLTYLAEVSTLQKSLIKTHLAPNTHTNIPTDDDGNNNNNNNNLTTFQKHTKTETSEQNEKSHTQKHVEDSFKENIQGDYICYINPNTRD